MEKRVEQNNFDEKNVEIVRKPFDFSNKGNRAFTMVQKNFSCDIAYSKESLEKTANDLLK